MRLRLLLPLLSAACVAAEDEPSKVFDLRVLGMATSPPELMAETCALDLPALLTFSQPVELKALLADPKGGGRAIEWELLACAWQGDRTCETADDRVSLSRGTTAPGELTIAGLRPGAAQLPNRGQPLLQQVFEQDTFKGLGGLRLPLVLRVKAGEEEVYAQKLMVFSCRYFPKMKPNQLPVVPRLDLNADVWPEAGRDVVGAGPFRVEATSFFLQQEEYVVPSFELQPVQLVERWKIAWHTDYGRFAPNQTGGEDLGGQESLHRVEWIPPPNPEPRDVNVWAVVRDGRGGSSWLVRKLRFRP